MSVDRRFQLGLAASLVVTLAGVASCNGPRRSTPDASPDAGPDEGPPPVVDSLWPADARSREAIPGPFLVESTVPASSEWGVACEAPLEVSLNRDVDAASITPATFTVNSKGGAVTGSFTVSGSKIVFQPKALLPVLQPVTATLTTGVLDTKGTPLWGPYSWTFGCDSRWSAPVWVSDMSTLSVSPEVSLADGGSAIVVWFAGKDGTLIGSIAFSRCDVSTGSCTVPETLGTDVYGFDLAGNGAGQAIVVGRGTSSLWSREFDPATKSWRPASVVASSCLDGRNFLDVSMDGLGNATVIWREHGLEQDEINVRRYAWEASAWEPATVLDSSPLEAIQVRVAENSGGTAIALWGLADNGIQGSLMASRNGGQGWTKPTRVAAERPETKFSLDIDQAGNAIVVWAEHAAASPGIWSSRLAAGTAAWTAPFKMDTMCCSSLPFVAMNAGGKALVAWMMASPIMALWTRRYDPGTDAWTAPLYFRAPKTLDGYPALTMDPDGNATVAWYQIVPPSTSAAHVMRFYDGPSQWGPMVQLSGGKGSPSAFAVDSNAAGQVVLASQEAASGFSAIFVAFLR